MKRMASLCAVAALGLATASHAAESSIDILDPIGKGPSRPFRAFQQQTCGENAICLFKFGKVPKKTILIVESVSCTSTPPDASQANFAAVTRGQGLLVGLVPPSAIPDIKLATSAYMPFKAGEPIGVSMGGAGGTFAFCTLTGRALPTD